MSVTVLTASLPERGAMLAEAIASVAEQTVLPEAHLISVDHHREGAAHAYNRVLAAVETEWVTFLDDDDLLLPHHIETLMANSDGADVVYAWCRSEGHDFRLYNQPFNANLLESRSIVPITAMVRTSLALEVGGMVQEWGYDWRFWRRVCRRTDRIVSVPEVTWVYRRHDLGNQSYGELAGAAS